jgi:type II secretory pathway pseudopilin PulG
MKSTKCVQCGFVGWSDLENCKACGAPLNQGSGSLPPAGAYYGSGDQSEGEQKGLAVAALVLGILSFFTFGLLGVGAIVGIVLSIKAMGRVSREPWRYGGRGMAIAGLVLSITSLASAVPIGIIAAIAIPNLMASYRAANEGSAIHSLRTISQAELAYQSNFAKYGTLQELAANGLIDPNLGSGTRNGYTFTITLDSENPEGFEVTGVPLTYGKTGTRSFYVDETFVIRGADNYGGPSTKMDEPLESYDEFPRGSRRRVEYLPQPAN